MPASRTRSVALPAVDELELRESPAGVSLRVRVQPRAPRDQIAGVKAGALAVRIAAPPVDGEANAALVRFLARALHVPAATIELRHGQSGRDKLLQVSGLDAAGLRLRLAGE